MSTRLDARSLIDLVLDDGSFSCWDDAPFAPVATSEAYAADLDNAGSREAP